MKIPKIALPHRVTIIPFKGSGAYGSIWETDPAKFQKNVPCRIDPKIQRLTSSNGSDVVQQAEAVFHPDYTIRQNDRIRWDLIGQEYTIQTAIPINMMGPHSIEAVLI
jgi:hypothetical protein